MGEGEKEPEHEGPGQASWTGRAGAGSGAWRVALAKSAPESQGRRINGLSKGPGWAALKRAICWVPETAPGERESRTLSPQLPLSFFILSRVSLKAV